MDDRRRFRMLCLVDDFTRKALAIKVDQTLNLAAVIEILAEQMLY